mmetsp:Transcript_11079/g.23659  ORF Transcript_11079/g.23659 Transcript_11079/m.23659 type:complete len:125 (+) Transcript_11079:314-688(+)
MHCRVAARNRIGSNPSDLIEGDVVDAEAPNEILNRRDVLLMGFRGEQGFEQPRASENLSDVTKFRERSDCFLHDWSFSGAIVDLFNADRPGGACVNYAFVILHGHEEAFIVKYGPVLFDEGVDL